MTKQPEKTTQFSAEELRAKAKVIEQIAKDLEEMAESVEQLPGKIVQLKFESNLNRGIVYVFNWIGSAKAAISREMFVSHKKTGIHDQQKKAFAAKVAEKEGQYSKPKKKE